MRTGVMTGKGVRDGWLWPVMGSLLVPSAVWAHQAPAAVTDPTVTSLLPWWSLRIDVILVVAILAGSYTFGWWRLRNKGRRAAGHWWQPVLYLTGLMVVCLALLSPIDRLAGVLFTMHMVQHLLLIMYAAPLLLLANPLPAFLWALPRRTRHMVGRLLIQGSWGRCGLSTLTWMPVAWLVFVANLWVWHHPAAYQAALWNGFIHDLQHLAFFGTALLFWWPLINPAPRVHGRVHSGLHILYFGAATGQNVLLGAVIALTERALYPFYAAAPRLWDLSPLNDQALGGGIMWVAAHMYLLPILLALARMLNEEERVVREREAAAHLQGFMAQHAPLASGATMRPAPQAQQDSSCGRK